MPGNPIDDYPATCADDDPKTAEIISKVLMVALDTQIKDPTILEQLRS